MGDMKACQLVINFRKKKSFEMLSVSKIKISFATFAGIKYLLNVTAMMTFLLSTFYGLGGHEFRPLLDRKVGWGYLTTSMCFFFFLLNDN